MAGVPTGGHVAGYRYLFRVGELEYYMNNLGIEEESIISGRPICAIFANGDPTVGQTFSIIINGVPVDYTVTSQDMFKAQGVDPRQTVLLNIIGLINQANISSGPGGRSTVWAGSSNATNISAGTAALTAPPIGQLLLTAYSPMNVTLSQTGNGMYLSINMPGDTYLEPSLDYKDANHVSQTAWGYINVCMRLRKDILMSRNNLGLIQAGKGPAGGVVFRENEIWQRVYLFRAFTAELGNLLYAGPDPTGRLASQSGGRVFI